MKMLMGRISRDAGVLIALGCLVSGVAFQAHGQVQQRYTLQIKVIHASSQGNQIDPALRQLAREFSKLSFTSYALKDQMQLQVIAGASSRVQLPNGMWMQVRAEKSNPNGMLGLVVSSDKPRFKTRVNVKAGATIAVGGPPYEQGALIFAITRLQADLSPGQP